MGSAWERVRFFVHSGGLTRAGGLAARQSDLRGGLTSPDGLVAQTVWLALLGRPARLVSSCRHAHM